VKIILVAALTRRRVIGNKGRIPWHLSEDLKKFKQLTTGHTVLMGRATYDSIGKPLPNRRNIVLTSRPIDGLECYSSLDKALRAVASEEMVFVIGGGKVYAQTLERADKLHLTIVEKDEEGDAFFPPYEHLIGSVFSLTGREPHEGFVIEEYIRMPQ
jgi:dihydrofolate reductase